MLFASKGCSSPIQQDSCKPDFFFPACSESTALGSTSWRPRKGTSELKAAVAWSSFYLRYPRAKLLLLLLSFGLCLFGFLSVAVGVILGLAIKLSHLLVESQFRGKHFFHPINSEMSLVIWWMLLEIFGSRGCSCHMQPGCVSKSGP